ncbi:cell division protein ZapE [Halomonas nitroreducens]|uniref:Cell division protein ZapE n=1 Tax=Halomonas nitroreducens TaxID=447425 RepID=A0A3S0JVS9_9GAMM|nr:cell division protein ZapE [Halomonas nitroreducens]RTQ99905.1 cell division protein ZapE [Halomonas nitroreducens]
MVGNHERDTSASSGAAASRDPVDVAVAPGSPLDDYREAIECGSFVADAAQWRAVEALEATFQALQRGEEAVAGVYLWGSVGRGKTWLMDRFARTLTVPARRQHFHHFMRWVHRRQFQLSGTPDPLRRLAAELAADVRVLCLDELFVSDIADAMLLGRLLGALFEEGVVLVATSNQAPAQLYADGFNRERFLPAIDAIIHHMGVVHLDGDQDHRRHPGQEQRRYWIHAPGQPSPLAEVFARLSDGQATGTSPIELGHRDIPVQAHGDDVLWCHFAALCEQPLSALDFIGLCDRYRHLLIGEVPRLDGGALAGGIARGTEDASARVATGDRELPALTRQDDGVRRFIALVDECYDRGVPLYLEAHVPLESLYRDGHLAFPFQRTLSRLREMQLARFGRD